MKKLTFLLLGLFSCFIAYRTPEAEEVLIDTVVASVNGKPITLRELSGRLRPPREMTLREASKDPEVRYILDMLIMERLIHDEAERRRLSASDSEVERYIDEIATRNGLDRNAFENALKEEGRSLPLYRRQVETDILRSKLVADLMNSLPAISEKEIENYLDEHPELKGDGTKLKLRQIFLPATEENLSEIRERMEDLLSKLEDGERFENLAREYSEGVEAKEGGSLGVVSESDLSATIFDAVFSLEEGEASDIVKTPAGLHIFLVEKRFEDEDDSRDELEEEVRELLEQQKLEVRMQSYFATEIFETHTVDKKI